MAEKIQYDIVANDYTTDVFKRVAKNTTMMASDVNNSMIKFSNGLRAYNNSMSDFNRVARRTFGAVSNYVYDFTRDAINNFTELERQHAKTMGAMANNYDKTAEVQERFIRDQQRLKDQAIRLGMVGPDGKGSLYDASQISYAQTALVKAGKTPEEVANSGAVQTIIKFAGGNDLTLDAATSFAVNLGTQFDVPMEKWGEMLDKVTRAADISVIDVPDIMESLKYAGGIASGLGRPLDEVLGALSVMGNAGLKGSMAGTGLQAMFTRLLSPVGKSEAVLEKAPGIAGEVLEAFIASVTDAQGTFKPLDEITPMLDEAMSALNDTEQAWFAHKLFGLFQMKAAYALKRPGVNGENVLSETINDINRMSAGTNDAKWSLMIASQYGQLEALANAYSGFKTDVGSRLSPVVSAIASEMFKFLINNGDYNIDFSKIKTAVEQSGEKISEQYGEQLGETVANLGNMGIDASRILAAITPTGIGMGDFALKMLSGNFSDAFESLSEAVEDTEENIAKLPSELQDLARNANKAMLALGALASINVVTKIAELFGTLYRYTVGSTIKSAVANIDTANASIKSATSTVSSTTTTISSSLINATTNSMNVNANVVNVFGGKVNDMGGGSSGGSNSGPSVPPLLPSGPGMPPLLPPGSPPALPSGGQLLLPGAVLAGGAAAGKSIKMVYNPFTKSYMTRQAMINGMLAKGATIGAVLASAKMMASPGLFASNDDRMADANDWLDKYAMEMAQNGTSIDDKWDSIKYTSGIINGGYTKNDLMGRYNARQEMMGKFTSYDGLNYVKSAIDAQISSNGKVTEGFLKQLLSYTDVNGNSYVGSNEDMLEILSRMYSNFDKFDGTNKYLGRFNDDAINEFVKNNDSFMNIDNIVSEVTKATQLGITNGLASMPQSNFQFAPNIDVKVQVDKDGNVKGQSASVGNITDYSGFNSWYYHQSSRFGAGDVR